MANLSTIAGNIFADSGIDPINVVLNTGSYSNPSWITALSWTKISDRPTTLAGYGISDAVPSSRTLTINGTSYDLSANRSWTIAAGVSSIIAGTGISVSGSGNITVTNTGVLSINGSTGAIKGIITTSNYNSYSPTLTGGGASGTWGINVTGTSGSISGFNNPTTAATANTIAYRDSLGDLFARYFMGGYVNTSDDTTTTGMTYIMAKFGDNYHRSASAAKVATFISGQSMNIAGYSTYLTSNNSSVNGGFVSWNGNLDTTNNPNSDYWYGMRVSHGDALSYYSVTFAVNFFANTFQYRRIVNGVNQGWITVLDSGNYNSYSPTLGGSGASGTWGISITGSAGSASSASTAGTVTHNASRTDATWYNAVWASGTPSPMYSCDAVQIQSSTGSIRANVFYDNENTAYYLNPAGTSQLLDSIFGDNSGSDQGIQIKYGNDASGYGRIRFYQSGANHSTIHSFSNSWQGGTLQTASSGAINLAGALGVTFGDWSSPDLWVDKNGVAQAKNSLRAPIFYDSQDVAYYLDPNGTSNLNKFSAQTMSYNDMNSMSINSPYAARYSASSTYRNGTMGYAQIDFNIIGSNWGSGFIDSWSNPANAPGGSSHYVGIQAMHANFQDSTSFYGFQMVCAGEAINRFFLRSAWPTVRSWVEMIHSGNIASQSVSYANSAGSAASAARAFYSIDGFTNTGAHTSSYIQNELPAANNGAVTGRVVLRQWCSEPGVTWDYAGFGYNVNNDGGSPNGFSRFNTNFGQAYMRFASNGDWYFYNTTAAGARTTSMSFSSTGVASFGNSITATGDITAFSDIRIKTNIETITGALDKVIALRGVYYNRTDNGDTNQKLGVIAQEIQKILPQVVHTQKDGMLSVSYGNIVGVLIEAIKEQQTQIEELKKSIN